MMLSIPTEAQPSVYRRWLLVVFSLVAVLISCGLNPSAEGATVRYDLFVRSWAAGRSLHRLHGETGEILYKNFDYGGFFLATGPDGAIYLSNGFRIDPRITDECSNCVSNLGISLGNSGFAFGGDGAVYFVSGRWLIRRPLNPEEQAKRLDYVPNTEDFYAPSLEALVIGPDGHFYAGDRNGSAVYRFDGASGEYLDVFASDDSLQDTRGIAFGPDGDLYVAGLASDNVVRFDGTTGAFDTVFASGIDFANGIAFGPDGDLFVAMEIESKIVRIDGTTGEYLGYFATGLVGNLVTIAFAPVPIPEPASATLLASVGLVWITRRRRSESLAS